MLVNFFFSFLYITASVIGLANAAGTSIAYSAERYNTANIPEYHLENNPVHADADCTGILQRQTESGVYSEDAMNYHCAEVRTNRDTILPSVPIYLSWKLLCLDSKPKNPVLKTNVSKAIKKIEDGIGWGKEKQCYRKTRDDCTVLAQHGDAVVEWCTQHEEGFENRFQNGFWCPSMADLALRMVRECQEVKIKGRSYTAGRMMVEAKRWGKTIYGDIVVRKA